jgi:hypothetical protein
MAVMRNTSRTEHLLALMTKGDDLFNARDWQALDAVHHPDMIAHVTGSAEPIYGREAHAAAMQQLVRMFPDIRVHTPYPVQFGDGDWITVVTNVTGTFTGEMTLPDGNVIAPTGSAFDLAFAQTSKWGATSSSSSRPSGTPRCRRSSSDSRSSQARGFGEPQPHGTAPPASTERTRALAGRGTPIGRRGCQPSSRPGSSPARRSIATTTPSSRTSSSPSAISIP